METKRILILEDDLEAVSLILKAIKEIEDKPNNIDFGITVLSEYTQVEEYINKTKTHFDIILLDRDCKACGSFHVLDFEKFANSKIISISSVPEYNERAIAKGAQTAIWKDYSNLHNFVEKVMLEIEKNI
jgi:CheY-like chemotaxis protein